MSASSAGYLALLVLIGVSAAIVGCNSASNPKPPEQPKPIITVCSGCGSEFESYGPGEPKPITTCPNCPMTPEEFERLKEEVRKRRDEAR